MPGYAILAVSVVPDSSSACTVNTIIKINAQNLGLTINTAN